MTITGSRRRAGFIARDSRFVALVVVVIASGCVTLGGARRDSSPTHPANDRRIAVLPIWLRGSQITDESLTGGDLRVLNAAVAENTAKLLAPAIAERGYVPVAPIRYIVHGESPPPFDDATSAQLATINHDFGALTSEHGEVLARINRGSHGGRLSDYRLSIPQSSELVQFGVGEGDVVALLHTTITLETPRQRKRRKLWDWTGGVLLFPIAVLTPGLRDPVRISLVPSADKVRHEIVIVDADDGSLLYYNDRTLLAVNPLDTDALRSTVVDVLAALPAPTGSP